MKPLLPILLLSAGLNSVQAQSIHVDFGNSSNETAAIYNNVSSAGLITLNDDAGVDTGISLELTGGTYAGTGAFFAGPYPTEVASQPTTAVQDSLFIRNTGNGNSATIALFDLDPMSTYGFLIYGARGNNGLEAIFNVTDNSGVQSQSISNVYNNETEVVVFENLVPDVNNEIVIEFTSAVSSSSGAAFNYLGITVAEPEDTDDDGMPDFYEIANGLDINVDDTVLDKDMDGLTNLQEYLGQDASGVDTTFGQTKAGEEDSDGDGVFDGVEVSGSMNPWDETGAMVTPPTNGGPSNPNSADSDMDTLTDFEELDATNGSVTDPNYFDTDQDGLTDLYEINNNLDPTDSTGDNGAAGDPDGDNLDNFFESQIGTDPHDEDSDDDTLFDDVEDSLGTNPLLADSDGDAIDDATESAVDSPSSPFFADTDIDGFADLIEIEAGSNPDDETSLPTFPSIAWSAVELTSTAALSTEGTLLFAENFNGATTTVNGITFEGAFSPSPAKSSENFLSLMTNLAAIDSYDDEIPELTEMFETSWWISGAATTNVAVRGLTPGLTYQIQFGRADDRTSPALLGRYLFVDGFGGNTGTGGVGSDNTVYSGPDNPALLVTGTFVASSPVQAFSTGQRSPAGATTGTQMAFLQVREVPAIIVTDFVIDDLRVSPGGFEVDFSGLQTTKSYQLVRSLDLTGFPTIVDGPRVPATASETFTDSGAPAGKALYRLEELP